MAINLTSGAFQNGDTCPKKHTYDGANLSPPIRWSGMPDKTASFALISDDPDAPRGTWVHWVIYNIPASSTGLPEGVAKSETLNDGALQGTNDFGKIGYDGPSPPPGPTHRYFFKVYALDARLNLPARATKQQLLDAMKGHILDQAEIIAKYGR